MAPGMTRWSAKIASRCTYPQSVYIGHARASGQLHAHWNCCYLSACRPSAKPAQHVTTPVPPTSCLRRTLTPLAFDVNRAFSRKLLERDGGDLSSEPQSACARRSISPFHRRTRLHLAKCAGVPHRRRIRLKQKRPRWGGRSCCRTSVRPTRRGSLPTAAARPPLANRRPIVVRPAPPMWGVVPLYEVPTIPSTPRQRI